MIEWLQGSLILLAFNAVLAVICIPIFLLIPKKWISFSSAFFLQGILIKGVFSGHLAPQTTLWTPLILGMMTFSVIMSWLISFGIKKLFKQKT